MAGDWANVQPSGGYRSKFERTVCEDLAERGVEFGYESIVVPFRYPPRPSRYTPDVILPNGIVVEIKGRLTSKTRKKHKLVKEQHPDLDLRFLFSRAEKPIYKGSKTTYGEWCEKHGIPYATGKSIPQEWIDEPENEASIAAIEEILA